MDEELEECAVPTCPGHVPLDDLAVKLVEVEATVLNVQPGDTIVLKLKERQPRRYVEELWRWANEMWPDNKVGVMHGADVEIEIVRPED